MHYILHILTGLTYVHPLLPNPFDSHGDATFLDISVLELEPEAQEVILSMKRLVIKKLQVKCVFTIYIIVFRFGYISNLLGETFKHSCYCYVSVEVPVPKPSTQNR